MGFEFQAYLPPKGLPPRPPLPQYLPIDLEIGCGVGLHPILYCRAHPERHLIAIEHTKTRFEKFLGRVRRHPELQNLHPVHANAISWVSHQLREAEIERCFLLYPNPYPKSKHRNQRWHNMPFLGELLNKIRPGGTLTLATNELWYMEEAIDVLEQRWQLRLQYLRLLRGSDQESGRTHFERKYLASGQTCYDAHFLVPSHHEQRASTVLESPWDQIPQVASSQRKDSASSG